MTIVGERSRFAMLQYSCLKLMGSDLDNQRPTSSPPSSLHQQHLTRRRPSTSTEKDCMLSDTCILSTDHDASSIRNTLCDISRTPKSRTSNLQTNVHITTVPYLITFLILYNLKPSEEYGRCSHILFWQFPFQLRCCLCFTSSFLLPSFSCTNINLLSNIHHSIKYSTVSIPPESTSSDISFVNLVVMFLQVFFDSCSKSLSNDHPTFASW